MVLPFLISFRRLDSRNSTTRFLDALKNADYNEAKRHLLLLINDGVNDPKFDWIKLTDANKRTAWHCICRTKFRGDDKDKKLIFEIAHNLLSVTSDDDFFMKDEDGCIPFHYLFKKPSHRLCPSLVRLLLNHCRPRNILQKILLHKCNCGLSPLQQLSLRHKKLSVSLLGQILKDCCDTNSSVLPSVIADRGSNTLLHFAAITLCDPKNNLYSEDNEYLLLDLWIKYSPSALIMYNHRGHLPIDDLIDIFVIKFVTKTLHLSQPPQQEQTNLNSDFYYCRVEKKRLNTEVEQQIYEELWPKLRLFLKATYQYRYTTDQCKELSEAVPIISFMRQKGMESMCSLHLAAACPFLPVIVFMCAKIENPEGINQPVSEQRILPLHLAASSLKITTSKDQERRSSTHSLALSRWDNGDDTNTPSLPIIQAYNYSMHNLCSHSMIEYLLELNKDAARCWTKSGQLPLHLACMYGRSWKDICALLQAAPDTIRFKDTQSRLYPFMLAAADDNNTMDVVYQLLLFDPEIINT